MVKSKSSKTEKRRVAVKKLPVAGKKLTKTQTKRIKGGTDGSGNTIYISPAGGGAWKTR